MAQSDNVITRRQSISHHTGPGEISENTELKH